MDIQEIISNLKQLATECDKVTSDNVSHRISNIEHGILNIADYIENYIPLGWHPASEPPEYAKEVIVLFKHGAYHDYPLIPMKFKYLGKWFMDVKYWCYSPDEE